MRCARARAAALALVLSAASCQGTDEPFAEAFVLEALDQAIGGPTANARIGDVMLQNDRIRAVIEQGAVSFHPADVGGTLIDLDLQRSEREFRRGNGLDQLGQIAPIANMSVVRAVRTPHVRVTRSTHRSDPGGAAAEVTAATDARPLLGTLNALTVLLNQQFVPPTPAFRMYNEYELRPGEQFVRVTSTVGFDVAFCPAEPEDGCNPECDDILYDDDCAGCQLPARCTAGVVVEEGELIPDGPAADRASILDIALGDLPRPLGSGSCDTTADCDAAAGEICIDVTAGDALSGIFRVCRTPDQRDAGVFLGDLLIFGGNLSPWLRQVGYDIETDIRRLFDQGGDTLAQPLELDGVFATGDRVSYGYAAPSAAGDRLGSVLVPIFSGPFSMGVTHSASCPTAEPACKRGVLVRFHRWLSVGTGDAASAQEPILRAIGAPLGTVAGVVTEAPSGHPVSGASVYALADPRDLPCDDGCQAACPLASDEPGNWTLDQLIDANRCRTRAPPQFPLGTAAIETFALTDPGTDPVLDGRYQMALRPGRYVLVAIDGDHARSPLVPVTLAQDQRTHAAFTLPAPGRLEYAVFDETGKSVAAKITVGRCLPRGACVQDADCATGELCQSGSCACPWKSLTPLELGGLRPADGVEATQTTASGHGVIELPATAEPYEVVVSHGPHYSVARRTVTIQPRVASKLEVGLRRQVDREGWIAADFHIHSTNSMDSGRPLEQRVAGFLADDMDFLSSTDHDWLTRYDVLIDEMGESDRLSTQVGVEMTTQEYGHYIAFPLRHQAYADGERVPSNGAVQWRGEDFRFTDYLPPGEIMSTARESLATGDLPVLIDVPHPYDYFDFYLLDAIDMAPAGTLLSLFNPMLDRSNFSGDFDVMELANSKAYSRIRRATVEDIRFYSRALDVLIAELTAGQKSPEEYARAVYDLSIEALKQRLHRTPVEQEAILAGLGGDMSCYCGSDGDCAAGLVCDHATLQCVEPPASGDPEVPGRAMCTRWRGVIDDWFNMLNHGVFRTGVSGSDVHGGELGYMRTFLRTGGTYPPYLQASDVVDALLHGRAVVSNGPMIHFKVLGGGVVAEVGDGLPVAAGQAVELELRVEKASWYDVDRIEVYRNGELIHWLRSCESQRGTDDPHAHECIQTGDTVQAWAGTIADTPAADAWYVVLVYGIDGRSLAPVYTSQVLASIGTPEITQRIYDIIPALRQFRLPRFPSQHPVFPFAFTNPIWVDVGRDGWTPPIAEQVCWCVSERDDHYPAPDGFPFPRRDIGCTGDGVCTQ